MRQAFIVGDGTGVLVQAKSLMALGWAVTATSWTNVSAFQPGEVLIANVPAGLPAEIIAAAVTAWSARSAVVVVLDSLDNAALNALYRAGAMAVVGPSPDGTVIAALAERVVAHAAAGGAAAAGRDDPSVHTEALPAFEALTMGESLLLQALLNKVGTLVPYGDLFHALGYATRDAMKMRRSLATQIVRLRKKLRGGPYKIRSRNNGGYILVPPRMSKNAPASSPARPETRRLREFPRAQLGAD
jgi:hypothetical protein